MKTLSAFERGKAARAAGTPLMVFDWTKAAQMIRERGAKNASAGLRDDWEWTGGEILRDGLPVIDEYTYLASIWAEPEISIDGGAPEPCWRLEDETPGWGSNTKWPREALKILAAE